MKIIYSDRQTGKEEEEKVYGGWLIELCYGYRKGLLSFFFSHVVLPLSARISFFSWCYGMLQKTRGSKRKIAPFIAHFGVDPSEFVLPVEAFTSFNDFFIRKLKREARPFVMDPKTIIMPADGRYLVFQDLSKTEGFWVKGKKFSMGTLLGDDLLAKRYERASMAIIRLCPTDYHRFHFPCDGMAGQAERINGPLYSVNPLALKKHIEILIENKRMFTEIDTNICGKIMYVEIGATNVGSICQTFTPGPCGKGEEKGFFEFGGSCLILLFEQGRITFDADLIAASARQIEVRGLLGQSLGVCK